MNSIRGRLLLALLSGLTIVLVGGGAAVYSIERQSLLQQFDANLRSRVQTLASLVKFEPDALVFESGDAPASTMAETYFEIRTQDGQILKRSANLPELSFSTRDVSENHMVIDNVRLPGPVHGRAVWYAFRPRVDPDDWGASDPSDMQPELLVAVAALDRGPMDRALSALIVALVAVGGMAALTVVLVVTLGVRWALKPLDRLGRQLGSISGHTISRRFEERCAARELAPMYRELNAMLDRVEQSLRRERLFVNAAAHEFRTPLAELRTTAEVAMKWPDARRTMTVLEEIAAIGRDMERLIESLLLISRSHALSTAQTGHHQPWASIVRQCVDRASSTIHRKRLQVAVHADESRVGEQQNADGQAAEIIVRNLIDNAVHYTPDDGTIAIRVAHSEDDLTALLVENAPVELTQDDLPDLFQPFWRSDGARSDRRHTGLGLTVVQEIAGVLGLRVEAALNGDRLQMRVSRVA